MNKEEASRIAHLTIGDLSEIVECRDMRIKDAQSVLYAFRLKHNLSDREALCAFGVASLGSFCLELIKKYKLGIDYDPSRDSWDVCRWEKKKPIGYRSVELSQDKSLERAICLAVVEMHEGMRDES